MLSRRQTLTGIAAVALLPEVTAKPADGFIVLSDDGERMTCLMPHGETILEVKLRDGTIVKSFYDSDIMEAGDFDFLPLGSDGEPDLEANSISDQVVAWRRIAG
jgi:hypothetical protein